MSNRRIVACTVAMIVLIAACAPVFGQSGPVTLSVWMPDASWAYNNPAWLMPEFIEWFEANNPDIKIEMNLYSGDRLERYLTNRAAGIHMDVIWTSTNERAGLAQAGFFMPLDEFFERDPLIAANYLNPEFLKTGVFLGRQLTMPDVLTWRAIYMSRDGFAEAGLALPSMNANDTWTMDEFIDAARRLRRTNNEGEVTRYGFSVSPIDDRFDTWARLYGGKLYDQASQQIVADSNEALAAFSSLRDMNIEMGVLPGDNIGSKANPAALVSGEVGMYMGPDTNAPGLYEQMGTDFTVRPLPRGPAGTTGMLGAPGWHVISDTPYPEQAWRFVRDRALYYAGVRDLDNLPPAAGLEVYAAPHGGTDVYEDIYLLLRDWLTPNGFSSGEWIYIGREQVEPPVVQAISAYVHGQESEEAIREAVSLANRALATILGR